MTGQTTTDKMVHVMPAVAIVTILIAPSTPHLRPLNPTPPVQIVMLVKRVSVPGLMS